MVLLDHHVGSDWSHPRAHLWSSTVVWTGFVAFWLYAICWSIPIVRFHTAHMAQTLNDDQEWPNLEILPLWTASLSTKIQALQLKLTGTGWPYTTQTAPLVFFSNSFVTSYQLLDVWSSLTSLPLTHPSVLRKTHPMTHQKKLWTRLNTGCIFIFKFSHRKDTLNQCTKCKQNPAYQILSFL
jgi:hypothetical protein